MIEHCISAINKKKEEENYRVYVTDMLKLLMESYAGAHEVQMDIPRYKEMIEAKKPNRPDQPPEEKAKGIITHISNKLAELGQ